jgi:hypothetical protein
MLRHLVAVRLLALVRAGHLVLLFGIRVSSIASGEAERPVPSIGE